MWHLTYHINNFICIVLITFCSFLVCIIRLDHMYYPMVCFNNIVTIMLQIEMSHFPYFRVQNSTAFMAIKSR